MPLCGAKKKVARNGLVWLLSFLLVFFLVVPAAAASTAGSDECGSSITISLRATGFDGEDIFNENYEIMAGEITIGGFTLDRQTAMGAVATYAHDEGINFEIKDWGWGLSVDQLGNDNDNRGNWLCYINETLPIEGADKHILTDRDALHFVNYSLDRYTLSLSADKNEVEPGNTVIVSVRYTDGNGNPAPAKDANIYLSDRLDDWGSPVAAGASMGTTDDHGKFSFQPDQAGIFYLYAEWGGKSSLNQWPTVSLAVGEKTVTPGQDPLEDGWVKNGHTVLDALLIFQQADGSFWMLEDTAGAVEKATAESLAALVDLACGASAKHRAGQNPVYNPQYEILTLAIKKAVQWYQKNCPAPDSWEGLSALQAAGEDLNGGPWQDTQTWRYADPGFGESATGNEHIHHIFRLLSVGLDPAGAWGSRNLFGELAAQQQADGSFGMPGKHIWAIVALDAGRNLGKDVGNWETMGKREGAINHLLDQQNLDGSFGDFSRHNQLDFTGWSLIALSNYMDDPGMATDIRVAVDKALSFLQGRQQPSGGFSLPGEQENANSNAAVISGLVAVGVDLAIEKSITPIGDSETGDNGSSSGSVNDPVPPSITVGVEVVGKNTVHFSGNVTLPGSRANALEALRETRIPFSARENDNYIYEIAGEGEALTSSAGWKYKVNGVLPSIPAKSHGIRDGDEVLWFWAADAGASGPGPGATPSLPVTGLSPQEMAKRKEIISPARGMLAALIKNGAGSGSVGEGVNRTIVIGEDLALDEEGKAGLEKRLQENIVSIFQRIHPGEDAVISDAIGEILLQIKGGSFSSDAPAMELTAEEISPANLPVSPDYRPISPVYRLGPEGTVFLEPVFFAIHLVIPGGSRPGEFVVAWLDEENGQWHALPTVVDLTSGYACALLDHFSCFAVLAARNITESSASTPLFSDITVENFSWAREAIDSLARFGIIQGVGEGLFEPSRDVTRAEFTVMLVGALGLTNEKKAVLPFKDVDKDSWYFAAVKTAVLAGIVKGVAETTFEPCSSITREQMAVMLSRAKDPAANRAEEEGILFSDAGLIAPWALDGVIDSASLGLIKGFPDGSFQPQGSTSRAQAAVVLYRLLNVARSRKGEI